jgi:peptidyl-prolyl cis-trans isomerase SurA
MKKLIVIIFLTVFFARIDFAEARIINQIIAVVNNEVITYEDVNQLLSVLYAQYVHAFEKEDLLDKMQEAKDNILKQMIEDKLILSRAKELNIRVSEDEVKEKLDYVKSAFPSEKEFYDMLSVQGITLMDLKDRYREQIMIKKLVNFEIRSKVDVLPSEISAYYTAHRQEFKRDEKNKVRHILIKADDDVSFELAKIEIRDIYDKITQGGDFSEAARQFSQGPNKETGGDMGYISRGQMLPELDNAIFSLNPGEISAPVKSKLGYHLFKVEDSAHSGFFSLEDTQSEIKKLLFQEKFKKKLEDWVSELKANAHIEIKRNKKI